MDQLLGLCTIKVAQASSAPFFDLGNTRTTKDPSASTFSHILRPRSWCIGTCIHPVSSNMGFEQSSQASYWLFEGQETLMACKQNATMIRSLCAGCEINGGRVGSTRLIPQSFACGYQQRCKNGFIGPPSTPQQSQLIDRPCPIAPRMATTEHDILIHFHAHQIHRLVGPSAMYPELRRTTTALSTAVMLFRRFYLSNSVIDFPARAIAAASAVLAVKVDCEPSLPIRLVSHATATISHKTRHGTSEFRQELRPVSVEEIEEAERNLLVGLDYRLRCHHPYGAIRVVAGEISALSWGCIAQSYGSFSPRSVNVLSLPDDGPNTLRERATAVAQAALVYSDVHFLYPPGKIGFAAVAIILDGRIHGGLLGPKSRNYLRQRFPHKTCEEINEFERDVIEIICAIDSCPEIDLAKFYRPMYSQSGRLAQNRVAEIRRAFCVAAYFRKKVKSESSLSSWVVSRKRKNADTCSSYPSSFQMQRKAAKVTPIPYRMR